MKDDREISSKEFLRVIDQRNYNLKLWERERKDLDYVKINFEQWDYYLNEEDSHCVLYFYQKNLKKDIDPVVEQFQEENQVEIEFEIKEEAIEFLEDLVNKMKYFLNNSDDYNLEKNKEK